MLMRPLAIALSALALSSAQAQIADNAVVIEASGLSITKSDFEQMFASDPRMALAKTVPATKAAFGTDIGKAFALEAEARNRQLEQSPSVQLKIRNYTQQLLANELLVSTRKDFLKNSAALTSHYEQNKDNYAQPQVRQILVRTKGSQVAARKGRPELSVEQARTKAEALLAKLEKGADFAKLAKAESDDLGSNVYGGDIGFLRRGATGANFEAAAYSLPIGQLKIVQTEFGFHILRVESRKPMSLEAVRATIANELAHKQLDAIILNGYKLNTAYFGTPSGN